MREIRGEGQNIRKLPSGAKYAIYYYQREYKWQAKQVAELIDDLEKKELAARQGLYRLLAEEIWNPRRLRQEAT
jgi:hypothetical protein